jgi:hypothetical protein
MLHRIATKLRGIIRKKLLSSLPGYGAKFTNRINRLSIKVTIGKTRCIAV